MKISIINKIVCSSLLLFISSCVMFVRLYIHYHTLFQVSIGGLIGIIYGYLSYIITNYIIKYTPLLKKNYDLYYNDFSIFYQNKDISILILISFCILILIIFIEIFILSTSSKIYLFSSE